MSDHFFFALIFFSIGFATGGLLLYLSCVTTKRKLKNQVKKWEQKYQQSEEGWFRRFKELEKTKEHG